MPKLQINIPDGEPIKFDLTIDEVTVGRNDANDISINDASVSGNHAQLKKDGGNFRLVDLDSTNGTKVAGSRISEHLLSNGDEIHFGNVPASYTSEVADEPVTLGGQESGDDAATTEEEDPWAEDPSSAGPSAAMAAAASSKSGSAGFGAKEKKKDPTAALLFTVGTVAILACLLAAVMALQLRG